MAKYWLCELGSKWMIECTESAENLDGLVVYAAGASNEQRYFALPQGVAACNCKLQEVEGVYSLVEDTTKTSGQWATMRAERNAKLAACDWTQLADSPLGVEAKAAWAVYRQALRDLPENTANLELISWPVAP
jgi:hypothetical protein